MNDKQQELHDRLKKATDIIWKKPRTAAEAILIFEEFVSSFEQIAADLSESPDGKVAGNLREIMQLYPA